MGKTWLAIDGALEPIDYAGPTFFRFPVELAERVITDYSVPGEWVLNPFRGFGATLVAAQWLGRQAIGFEKDADRSALLRDEWRLRAAS
jgi:DNA modification methylase